MTVAQANSSAIAGRSPSIVMDLERLGSLSPSRLSFARTLLRHMREHQWTIERTEFALDALGYGETIYRITTPSSQYHVVVFAQALDDELRSDRVIAEAWDVTFCIVEGEVTDELRQSMALNVPLQEAGRQHPQLLVISRANKSVRNFDHFVEALSSGQQPNVDYLKRAGYIYRTTAVYGNGKFGIADYGRIKSNPDFGRPFSAQMAAVYVLRQFSIDQAEHIARQRSPDTAATLSKSIKRYLGIGNSTGLGMAPFLILHPQLIDRWLQQREQALAYALAEAPSESVVGQLVHAVEQAQRYFEETWIENEAQAQRNCVVVEELGECLAWLKEVGADLTDWSELTERMSAQGSLETQELINGLLIDLYPSSTQGLEDAMAVEEQMVLSPDMATSELITLLETQYDWAIDGSYEASREKFWFWYKSAEKEEPRLGRRGVDSGAEKELPLAIAPSLKQLHVELTAFTDNNPDGSVIEFLLANPEQLETVRRAQTMASTNYGEIRSNLWAESMKPMHLLRAKLSFLGANRFDPKGDLWVRVTFFQGSPLIEDLTQDADSSAWSDHWSFALAPPAEPRESLS